MPRAMPPIKSHIEWFVGFPVKARETLDPNELEALTPKMINTTPTTNMAMAIALFISAFVFVLIDCFTFKPADVPGSAAPK